MLNMRQKTIFIFGAGASKADKAPLQNELFSEIFDLLDGGKNYQDIKLKPTILEEIKDFLNKLYPIKEEPKKDLYYPTFSEVMGLIHFALIRDESFKGFSQMNLRNYSAWIVALIAIVLDKTLEQAPGMNKKFINTLYESFKKNHNDIENNEVMNRFANQNFFLNVNYDILLDSALYDLISGYRNDIDYCTEIQYPIPKANKIKLFKPHGSLNWLYCKSCDFRIFGGDQKIAMEHFYSILKGSEVSCNRCHGGMLSALIVPPSFFKELHNYAIRNILISLENHLKEVQNLIFIGYSFPEADLHLKYLFKKAQLLGGFKKIILINKQDKDIKKEDRPYYYNVNRSFPGVELIDLSNEIPLPNGLEENSIGDIIEKLSGYLF